MSDLEEARRIITEVDRQIVEALAERFNAVAEVLGYKVEHGLQAVDPVRRQGVIEKAVALAEQIGGNADLTRKVIEAIVEWMEAQQEAYMRDGSGAFVGKGPATLEREPA